MVQQALMASLVWALALGGCRADDPVKKELAKLEGTWALVTMEINGRSLLKKDERTIIVVKGGKVTSDSKAVPKDAPELSKALDPSRRPKAITLPYEGKLVFYGIYEVEGDVLRVCGDGVDTASEKGPEARRPKAFDSKQGLLLVFRREKK